MQIHLSLQLLHLNLQPPPQLRVVLVILQLVNVRLSNPYPLLDYLYQRAQKLVNLI
jgi:hypothetical protein